MRSLIDLVKKFYVEHQLRKHAAVFYHSLADKLFTVLEVCHTPEGRVFRGEIEYDGEVCEVIADVSELRDGHISFLGFL